MNDENESADMPTSPGATETLEPISPSVRDSFDERYGRPFSVSPIPVEDLPFSDGEPLESQWHVQQMAMLIEIMSWHWRERRDYFMGGDLFVYFSEKEVFNRDFRGPDFFVVTGVDFDKQRKGWVTWQEGWKYPNLIVELMSPSTRKIDLETKLELYDRRFQTPEYVVCDPETHEIFAWRRSRGRYRPIAPNEHGRYELKEIGLSIGRWQGRYQNRTQDWVRFFHPNGERVLTGEEEESLRANAEKARADALADELARLKAQFGAS